MRNFIIETPELPDKVMAVVEKQLKKAAWERDAFTVECRQKHILLRYYFVIAYGVVYLSMVEDLGLLSH